MLVLAKAAMLSKGQPIELQKSSIQNAMHMFEVVQDLQLGADWTITDSL